MKKTKERMIDKFNSQGVVLSFRLKFEQAKLLDAGESITITIGGIRYRMQEEQEEEE